jgi:hypothetical protein
MNIDTTLTALTPEQREAVKKQLQQSGLIETDPLLSALRELDEARKQKVKDDAFILGMSIAFEKAKAERDEAREELSACEEVGGCGYWREAARLREYERDEARKGNHLIVCNYSMHPVGSPGCICRLVSTREFTEHAALQQRVKTLEDALNSPETEDFDKGVPLEAGHQVIRWGAEHDAGKKPEDWFWLCGYLAGKALHAAKSGDVEKAKHHCISTAAMMRNWHRAISTGQSIMRPGLAEEKTAAVNPAPEGRRHGNRS